MSCSCKSVSILTNLSVRKVDEAVAPNIVARVTRTIDLGIRNPSRKILNRRKPNSLSNAETPNIPRGKKRVARECIRHRYRDAHGSGSKSCPQTIPNSVQTTLIESSHGAEWIKVFRWVNFSVWPRIFCRSFKCLHCTSRQIEK